MPDRRRTTCRVCGRHRDEVGAISWTGKCQFCWPVIFEQNLDGLHYHAGPYFKHWRRGMAKAVGAVLLDDGPNAA